MPSLQKWKSVAYISMPSVVEQDLLPVPMYDCKTSPVFLSMPRQACGRLWYVLHFIYIPSSVLTKKKNNLSQIFQRTNKTGKGQYLLFRGQIEKEDYSDFVYWLNQHLIHSFGTSIPDLAEDMSKIKHSDEHLWQWTASAMSYKFR